MTVSYILCIQIMIPTLSRVKLTFKLMKDMSGDLLIFLLLVEKKRFIYEYIYAGIYLGLNYEIYI